MAEAIGYECVRATVRPFTLHGEHYLWGGLLTVTVYRGEELTILEKQILTNEQLTTIGLIPIYERDNRA
jgi:hypothetical protein